MPCKRKRTSNWSRYTEQAKTLVAISMIGGIRADDVGSYESSFCNTRDEDKVIFSVKQPILLKSVKVLSKRQWVSEIENI